MGSVLAVPYLRNPPCVTVRMKVKAVKPGFIGEHSKAGVELKQTKDGLLLVEARTPKEGP